MYFDGDTENIDGSNCLIEIEAGFATMTINDSAIAGIRGKYHKLNFLVKDFSISLSTTSWTYSLFYFYYLYNSQINIVVDNAIVAQAGSFYGVKVYESAWNTFNVNIESVTTTTGNTGTGFLFHGLGTGTKYNTIIGSSRDCDSSNYTDSDTNNEAALNLGGGLTAYATIALTEAAAGSDNDLCYVVETESVYRYEATAYSESDDNNTTILSTGDGGDTRWVAVAGKYATTNKYIGDGYSDMGNVQVRTVDDLIAIPEKRFSDNMGYVADYKEILGQTVFSSTAVGDDMEITPLINGNAMICYRDNTANDGKLIVVDPDGTVVSGPTQFTSTGEPSHIAMTTLQNGTVLIVCSYTNVGAATRYQIRDMDGDQVVAEANVSTDNFQNLQLSSLQNGNAMMYYSNDDTSDAPYHAIYNVSSDSWTNFTNLGGVTGGRGSIATYQNGNVLVAWNQRVGNPYYGYYKIVDQLGNVVKATAAYDGDGGRRGCAAVALKNGNMLLAFDYNESDHHGYFMIFDNEGEVIVSRTQFDSSAIADGDYIEGVLLPSGNAMIIYRGGTSSRQGKYVVISQEGVVLKEETYSATTGVDDNKHIIPAVVTNGNLIIAYRRETSDNGVLRVLAPRGQLSKFMVAEHLASAPGSPIAGQIFWNTTTSKLQVYNGATWDNMH